MTSNSHQSEVAKLLLKPRSLLPNQPIHTAASAFSCNQGRSHLNSVPSYVSTNTWNGGKNPMTFHMPISMPQSLISTHWNPEEDEACTDVAMDLSHKHTAASSKDELLTRELLEPRATMENNVYQENTPVITSFASGQHLCSGAKGMSLASFKTRSPPNSPSPNLKALLQKFDENNKNAGLSNSSNNSVLYKYLYSSQHQDENTKYVAENWTLSSGQRTTRVTSTITSPVQSSAQKRKSKSNKDNNETTPVINIIPQLSIIGEVVDKQFQKSSANTEPIWIKDEPDWGISDEEMKDPKAAYILQNLRAGLREQQSRKGSLCSVGHDLEIIGTSAKRRKAESSQFDECVKLREKQIKHKEHTAKSMNITPNESTNNLLCNEKGVQCEILTDDNKGVFSDNDIGCDRTEEKMSPGINAADTNVNDSHTCVHCNISFHDAVLHSIHLGCHDLKKPFLCNVCGTECADKYSFYTHIMRGHSAGQCIL